MRRARKSESSGDDDSLLVRSAESLGRVIGSLQRQVQAGSKRVSLTVDDVSNTLPDMPRFDGVFGAARAKGRKPTIDGRPSAPRKAAGTGKGASARKAGGARRSAGSRKGTRGASSKKR